MTITDPRVIDPNVVAEIAAMFRAGSTHDDIIARTRRLGLHKVECIKLFRNYGGVKLGGAKDIVHLSPVWADRYESDEAFHDDAENAFELIMKEEETTAA